MNEKEAVLLAVFDDEATPRSALTPGVRPDDRPRPGPTVQPPRGPISLALTDSAPDPEPATLLEQDYKRATLPFDLGLLDPHTASFLVMYAAGTPLGALKPRTVSIPPATSATPLTELTLYVRSSADAQPVPFHTFRSPEDMRGHLLTLQIKDPANPATWLLGCNGPAPGRSDRDRA
jgi:hypothetical protein